MVHRRWGVLERAPEQSSYPWRCVRQRIGQPLISYTFDTHPLPSRTLAKHRELKLLLKTSPTESDGCSRLDDGIIQGQHIGCPRPRRFVPSCDGHKTLQLRSEVFGNCFTIVILRPGAFRTVAMTYLFRCCITGHAIENGL